MTIDSARFILLALFRPRYKFAQAGFGDLLWTAPHEKEQGLATPTAYGMPLNKSGALGGDHRSLGRSSGETVRVGSQLPGALESSVGNL